MTLVIGEISYTNILPMFYYADRERLTASGCEFVPAIPAKLNKDMAEGRVHVGGISSFSYGEYSNDYYVMPDLSVSSMKNVGSIFLFSKYPIDKLEGSCIALTSSSATSVNLLKIILQNFYRMNVSYRTSFPDYKKMMSDHDACLLIGDDAILASFTKEDHIYMYDLGALWAEFTSLPMTYAVFAVRKEALQQHAELLQLLHSEFLKSKQKSIDNRFTEMISSIQYQLGGSAAFWRNYFSGLNFQLSSRHMEGLHHFYDLAYDMKLLDKKVSRISIWDAAGRFHSV